jgi:pantoate--beta-alanine ligase
MLTVEQIAELRRLRARLPAPVGFVPTMGYLHAGHISLVELAKRDCAAVVASIFLNPTQFGPNEDLESYPRDIPADLKLLEEAGVDLVWLPTPEIMYPPGFQTWVDVEEVSQPLEGAQRPGHFRGVSTVVAKLFNAVTPDKAYFGQKDAQQVAVVKQMARDLTFPVEIRVGPTLREADGLAMSSRNSYLDAEPRQAASVLYRALNAAKEAYEGGEHTGDRLRAIMAETIAAEPLAEAQYVSCADRDTLEELDQISDGALLSMAVYVGQTRLIDNLVVKSEE